MLRLPRRKLRLFDRHTKQTSTSISRSFYILCDVTRTSTGAHLRCTEGIEMKPKVMNDDQYAAWENKCTDLELEAMLAWSCALTVRGRHPQSSLRPSIDAARAELAQLALETRSAAVVAFALAHPCRRVSWSTFTTRRQRMRSQVELRAFRAASASALLLRELDESRGKVPPEIEWRLRRFAETVRDEMGALADDAAPANTPSAAAPGAKIIPFRRRAAS